MARTKAQAKEEDAVKEDTPVDQDLGKASENTEPTQPVTEAQSEPEEPKSEEPTQPVTEAQDELKASVKVVDIDAEIETRKVAGTELQAYLRQLIMEA